MQLHNNLFLWLSPYEFYSSKHKNGFTIIVKSTQVTCVKRYLMAAGTKFNPLEIEAAKKILSHVNSLLRKGPLEPKDYYELIKVSTINPKIFQHLMHVEFSNAIFVSHEIQKHFPNVIIGSNSGLTNNLDWNDFISVYNASKIKESPFFSESTKAITYIEQAFKNTGQKNPDYFYYEIATKKSSVEFSRYFDLKSGQYSPMKGHITLCNNSEIFDINIKRLVDQQLFALNLMGYEFADCAIFLKKLIKDPSMTWKIKNEKLQIFYKAHIHRFPVDKNPSMIFYYDPLYDVDQMPPKKYSKLSVNSDGCSDITHTRETLIQTIIHGGYDVANNYIKTQGASPFIQKAIKDILSEIYHL